MNTATLPFNSFARSRRVASACWLLLALLLPLGSSAVHAQAQAPDAASATDAEALLVQGVKLREQGQDQEALTAFERAYALLPTPRALAQRALAEQALGGWAQAETHLSEALTASADPWITRNRQALEGALAVIREHLGQLQVNGGIAGAELRLDGQLVGTLPLAAPLRIVVGRSLLEVALAGHYPVRREITIKAGSLSTEIIQLVPIPAQPAAVSAPVEPSSSAVSRVQAKSEPLPKLVPVVFWTGVGVTAVVGSLALWSRLNASAKNDAYEEYAANPDATAEEALRGYDDALSAQTRTNVLLVGTGVAAAATLAIGLFFTQWDGSSVAEAKPTAASTKPQLAVFSDGASHGLLLHRSF